jgi:hypothetical protein
VGHGIGPSAGRPPRDVARFVTNAFTEHIAEADDLVLLQTTTAAYVVQARDRGSVLQAPVSCSSARPAMRRN